MFPHSYRSSCTKSGLKRRQFFLSFVNAKDRKMDFTLSAPGARFGFIHNVKTWSRRTSHMIPQEPTYCTACQAKQVGLSTRDLSRTITYMSRTLPSQVLPILTVTDVRPSRVLPTLSCEPFIWNGDRHTGWFSCKWNSFSHPNPKINAKVFHEDKSVEAEALGKSVEAEALGNGVLLLFQGC